MIIKKYLGQIVTEMGFVTKRQLDEALQRQKQIMKEQISDARLQRDRLVTEARLSKDTDLASLLGQILIEMGLVVKEQLDQALKEQEKSFETYMSLENDKLGSAIEIGSLINSTLNLAEVLHIIMKHVNHVTNSVASTLMLLDEKTGELVFSVPLGTKADRLIDIRIPPGKGIAGWVAEQEQPVSVPNVKEDSRFYQEIDEISGCETKSILCVPLKVKTKLIGVLEVINKFDGTCFTKEDEVLLTMFGYQAAVAIENARLYGELKEQRQEGKRTEALLRESEEKYRGVVENANEGIIVSQDGMLKFVNRKAVEISGYSEEELMSRPFIDFVYPDDRQVVMQHHLKRAKGEEIPGVYVLRFFNKDGTVKWLENNGVVIAWEGKPATLNLLIDITERKKMEEGLLRAQKLESVGVLAGGIAHDFNNILTTILGNVSLARMQVNPGDELFDLLREAETASTRAQALTKQLLTFAKGGAPVKEPTLIKDILKESSSFSLRGSKSGCEFSIAEDLWLAEVDVGQISQVISNIVINANQAMPEGGIIRLAAENLIIEDRHRLPVKPGRYIKISITDQGVGIAEKHLINIFDPYFTTKQAGSGLGLATTYAIIKKHDGHITVESQMGVGTTFHIYLPASDKPVPEKEEAKLIKGQGRILLMDDEAPLRKMVGRMLKNLGYESEFAKDGAEAIRMVKDAKEAETPYDAVILDLTIPGKMGGKEAINKLLEIDPELKAIVSSGYSDDPVLANFQEYGFKGMMPKPFESHSLGKVLHEVLQGEKD